MATTAALVWYLVIAGPQGGMVVLPSTFDTREQCTNAITEYQKQPTPQGWAVQCVPSASPFTDEGAIDFGGPFVHGRKGERFLYLSWGAVDPDFEMFRRAKLVFADCRSTAPKQRIPWRGLVPRSR